MNEQSASRAVWNGIKSKFLRHNVAAIIEISLVLFAARLLYIVYDYGAAEMTSAEKQTAIVVSLFAFTWIGVFVPKLLRQGILRGEPSQ